MMPITRVRVLIGAMGSLYLLALVAFVIRFIVKCCVTRRWNIDDYTFSAAFIFANIHAMLISICVARGYGLNFTQLSRAAFRRIEILQYFAQFFYILSFGFCRISYAQFIGTVARGSFLAGPARWLTVFAAAWTIVSMFVLAYDGRPGMPWTGTLKHPLYLQWLGVEFVGILNELLLFLLAGLVIKRFAITPVARVKLLLSFAVRILLIPVIFARAAAQAPTVNGPPKFQFLPVILMEVALSSSLMMGLATSLTSFLHSFDIVNLFLRARLASSRIQSSERYYQRLESFPEYQEDDSARNLYDTFDTESVIQRPIPDYPVSPPYTPPNSPAPPSSNDSDGSDGSDADDADDESSDDDTRRERITMVSVPPPCQCNLLPHYVDIRADAPPRYEDSNERRPLLRRTPRVTWTMLREDQRLEIAAMNPAFAALCNRHAARTRARARAEAEARYRRRGPRSRFIGSTRYEFSPNQIAVSRRNEPRLDQD